MTEITRDKAKVLNISKTATPTTASGLTINSMEKVAFSTVMVAIMMVSGSEISQTDSERNIMLLQGYATKGIGKTVNGMGKVERKCLMVHGMMVNTDKVKSTGKVC